MPDPIDPASTSPAAPPFPRRGNIYYVTLDPVLGSEQGGNRPALIIQNDVGNVHSPVVIVAAISSRSPSRNRPIDVWIESNSSGLTQRSRVKLNQIRTVDKRRLGRYVGEITSEEMASIDEAIRISLGLVSI